jgi:CRISPR-associated protein Csd1
MLRPLVRLAETLQTRADWLPSGYRRYSDSAAIKWVLEVDANGVASLREGQGEADPPRPYLNKAGTRAPPLLLADKAEYVLGLATEGKSSKEKFDSFWDLMETAAVKTADPHLKQVALGRSGILPFPHLKVDPKDTVAVKPAGGGLLFDVPSIRRFWQEHAAQDALTDEVASCAVCGRESRLLRKMPVGLKGFPSDVRISTFNLPAFESFGREQNLNAPMCYPCGANASAALSYLMDSRKHKLTLVRGDGLANEVAVFWTKDEVALDAEHDVAAATQALFTGRYEWLEDREKGSNDLGGLRNLLTVPWKPLKSSLLTDPEAFNLAVVSANKTRLVVRDWLQLSLEELQEAMTRYLEASSIVDPWGGEPSPHPIQRLLDAVHSYAIDRDKKRAESDPAQPDLVRAMLGTIYKGHPAPEALTMRAVQVFRKPGAWAVDHLSHRLAAAIKFQRTYDRRHAMKPTEELNAANPSVAYQCGRLFAVLDKAQGAALGYEINATLVERTYGAASSAPRNTFPPLLKMATQAHLPKAGWLNPVLEDVMATIASAGGFPRTLNLQEQADFALGFYQQRAHFRHESKKHKEAQE